MLSQMALRLAVVEALAPHALVAQYSAGEAVAAWPTLAQHRVLDSQIEAAATTESEAMTPIIAIFTDESTAAPQGNGQDAGIESHETVTLAIEIQVPLVARDSIGAPMVGVAETDALAEGFVNTICYQVQRALARARMDGPLRHVLVTIEKINSRAWADADTMVRFSARRIEMSCCIQADEEMPIGQVGLARLPQPLRAVAESLPDGSYGREAALRVASLLHAPSTFPALQELRLAVNFQRSPGSTQPLPPAASDPMSGDIKQGITHAG